MRCRCPNCKELVELVSDSSLSDIECPSCGTQFHLLTESETVTHVAKTKRLGHFDLLDSLGSGRFGTVWKAKDSELDRLVAVKVPRVELLDEADVELFFREARAAAQISHPSIVGIHEIGRHNGKVFLVCDFVDGANLQQFIRASTISFREAARICSEIAEALEAAHDAGVVHRDLKPANILLDKSAKVFITDFGLAKREQGELTVTVDGKILGTPAYMAPEQARGTAHLADARSDIYSVGVILYELLTGELPFRGERQILLLQIQRDEPVAPRKLNRSIPRDLETICLKCMEKEPKKRYCTASELHEDLERFRECLPIKARPVRLPERTWRACRRHPAVAGLILASGLALVCAGGLGIGLFFQNQLESTNRRLAAALSEESAMRQNVESAEAELRQLLYGRNVSQAVSELKEGRLRLARGILADCDEELRGWEWEYANSLCSQEELGVVFESNCESVAFSPDGSLLAIGTASGLLRLCSTQNMQEVASTNADSGRVKDVAFNDSGTKVISGGYDGTVRIWNVPDLSLDATLSGHQGWVTGIQFLPGGKQALSAGWDNQAIIWDIDAESPFRRFPGTEIDVPGRTNKIKDAACNIDGTRIATANWNHTATIWNSVTGERQGSLVGHTKGLIRIDFTHDGTRVVTAGEDNTVMVWNAMTGEQMLVLSGHVDAILGLAISHDDEFIATASEDTTVKLWDAQTGQLIRTIPAHEDVSTMVAFSPDSRHLATAGRDRSVRIWDLRNLRESPELIEQDGTVLAVGIDENNQTVFSIDSKGKVVRREIGANSDSRFWLGGKQTDLNDATICGRRKIAVAATKNDDVIVCRLLDGTVARRLQEKEHGLSSTVVAVSELGDRFAIGGSDGSIQVHSFESSGEPVRVIDSGFEKVICLTFDSAGSEIYAGFFGGQTAGWNLASGKVFGHKFEHSVWSIEKRDVRSAFFGDRRGTITQWDFTKQAPVAQWKGHLSGLHGLALTPSGRRLVSVSDDSTARVWDVATGREVFFLEGHRDGVQCVSISSDGRTIVTGCEDKTARVWSAGSVVHRPAASEE